jgi:hypothetical protein
MMRAISVFGVIVLSAGTLVLAGVSGAVAQKKLSYEQAYARCKQEVDKIYQIGSGDVTGRALRGGACMKQHGYNLKKSDKF